MKRTRASFWIGGVCIGYWTVLYIFVFRDLYLTFDIAGLILKMLVPVALVGNVVGMVLGLASWPERKHQAGLATALNVLPVIGILWFGWWLFFGVRF